MNVLVAVVWSFVVGPFKKGKLKCSPACNLIVGGVGVGEGDLKLPEAFRCERAVYWTGNDCVSVVARKHPGR